MIFLRNTVRLYGTSGAVNENSLIADLADVLEKPLQLKDGLLALSIFAQRRPDLLKQGYTILPSFADKCGHKMSATLLLVAGLI